MKVLGKRLLVEVRKYETQTASGIIIPEVAKKERRTQGTVLAIGSDVTEVEVGQIVHFSPMAGTSVSSNSAECLVLKEDDILAVAI